MKEHRILVAATNQKKNGEPKYFDISKMLIMDERKRTRLLIKSCNQPGIA